MGENTQMLNGKGHRLKYNPNFIENLCIYIDRILGGHIEEKLQGNN